MKLFRLKIVSLNYQSVKLSTVLFRETVGKLITTISLNMGYIWALVDKKRQTFHDKLAKTFVVKTDKYGALIPIDREENTTIGQKLEFALIFGIFIFPLLGFITFFGFYYVLGNRPIQIKGIAMNPNYIDGQYYLAQKTNGNLAVGDVVFFQSPKDHDVSFIKRIIATAGDTVLIKGGSVYVNGKILDENKYLTPGTTTFGEAFLKEDQTITVPSNTYFVLGDNREHSSDSREWGFVQKDEIIGKVTFCYWNCYPK